MSTLPACVMCGDDEPPSQVFDLPCGAHTICADCLKRMEPLAIAEEKKYPLKCGLLTCPSIPNELVDQASANGTTSDATLLGAFHEKVKEHSILPPQRTYCANLECCSAQGQARFLDTQVLAEGHAVLCSDCSSVTCSLCKSLRHGDAAHICKTGTWDDDVVAHLKTLLDEEKWLWQKCYRCGSWVEKSEACNHMSCPCSAEFCLVCGGQWEGLTSCRWGCPKNERPTYDADGFNQNGYNPATGLDRDGNPWDPNHEHEQGDYDDEDDDDRVFDEGGFDQDGFDWEGFSRDGFDRDGFDYADFNANGFNRDGFDKSGRDAEGFFEDGCDLDGFDRNGISLRNIARDLYDSEGYDPSGFDVWGYNRDFLDAEGFDGNGYDTAGYNRNGFDAWGFRIDGNDTYGYDRRNKDREGYSVFGYDAHHKSREGEIAPGFHVAPDGNVRQDLHEGPSAEFMECEHRTSFRRGGATCEICRWSCPVFHQRCSVCDARVCRACDQSVEAMRRNARGRYPWPGTDIYGIDAMFERAETMRSFTEDA